MAIWDLAMSEATGATGDHIITAYYTSSEADLRQQYTGPGAYWPIAWDDYRPIGSFGYSRFRGDIAEVEKFFVAEAARGKGVGRTPVAQILAHMPADGYRCACRETVSFMTAALALYRSAGFQTCPRFRPITPGLDGISVFMDRLLP